MAVKWTLGLLSIFCFSVALATTSSLEAVTSKRAGESFTTRLEFNEPIAIKNAKVEYINQTVQIDIPGAALPSGKSLVRVDDDRVRSLYSYQLNDDTLRLRVIHHKNIDAVELKGHVHLSNEGNELIVRIDNPGNAIAKELPPKEIVTEPPVDLNEAIDQLTLKPVNSPGPEVVASASDILRGELKDKIGKRTSPVETISIDSPKSTGENDKSVLAEAEIPLFSGKIDKPKTASNQFMRMVLSLLVVLVLGAGVALFGRWWMKRSKQTVDTTKIRVMTQHYLGPKKSLAIVRVAGEFILIGVTDQNINHIKTLSLIDDEYPNEASIGFGQTLSEFSGVALQDSAGQSKAQGSADEEFSYKSVKDMVAGRLKEMRPL